MLGVELSLCLVLRELGLELAEVDDSGDALGQRGGEVLGGNNVLVGALRVGRQEADGGGLVGVERVRQDDLAGLEAGLVGDVALGGQVEPDGLLNGLVVVVEEVAFCGLGGLVLGQLVDVREEGLGGFEGLSSVSSTRDMKHTPQPWYSQVDGEGR